jgi:hypothetical protein
MLLRPRTLPTGFIAPCLPTKADAVPSGGQWIHEIKHEDYGHERTREAAMQRSDDRRAASMALRFSRP